MRIVNRSEWPDWALNVLAAWVHKRFKLPKHYCFIFRSTARDRSWRGTGYPNKQTIRLHRRYRCKWPRVARHSRAGKIRSGFPVIEHRTRLELLVGLMCHEAKHVYTRDEFLCEIAEQKSIAVFREEWPEIRRQLKIAFCKSDRGDPSVEVAPG
jgi:hypothetical protein